MTQLALPSAAIDELHWSAADWQRLWVATQTRAWHSLALVPAGPDGALDTTLDIAMSLARTGMRHLGHQIHVADATQLELGSATEFMNQVRASVSTGRVILALSPIMVHPVMVPVARTVDCALLCVVLGQTRSADAQRTVEEIGRDKFIGAFTVQRSRTAAWMPGRQ
jgi:hypothetical protein